MFYLHFTKLINTGKMIGETVTFVLVCILVSSYFNYQKRLKYFKHLSKRGIPGPKPNFIFGNFWELNGDLNKNIVIGKWIKKYGKIFGYFVGKQRIIVISDLDLIQNIFITQSKYFRNRPPFALDAKYIMDSLIGLNDERWKTVRKIISPVFSSSKVASQDVILSITECIENLQNNLKLEKGNNNEFDVEIHTKLQAFTLDVIAKSSLNSNENVYDSKNIFMNSVKEFFNAPAKIVELAFIFPLLKTLFSFMYNNLTCGRMIDHIVKKMKEYIHLFIVTNNKKVHFELNMDNLDTHTSKKAMVLKSLLLNLADKKITEREFIGNILLVILAGYETTANSVTFMLYILAKYKEIQNKLREDVKQHGINSNYLESVWLETLRYYPPVCLFVNRIASEDIFLSNVQFKKGDIIQVPVWHIHKNPMYWKNPEIFDPERFTEENSKNRHKYAFLAFGLGPRICLGNHFATQEAKYLISHLISRFELDFCEKTPNPLEFIIPTVIINPSSPVYLKFKEIRQ